MKKFLMLLVLLIIFASKASIGQIYNHQGTYLGSLIRTAGYQYEPDEVAYDLYDVCAELATPSAPPGRTVIGLYSEVIITDVTNYSKDIVASNSGSTLADAYFDFYNDNPLGSSYAWVSVDYYWGVVYDDNSEEYWTYHVDM